MKLQSVNNFQAPITTLNKNEAPKPGGDTPPPPGPQDGFKPSVGQTAIRTGIA